MAGVTTADSAIRDFVADLIAVVNARIPSERTLAREVADAKREAVRSKGLTVLDRELVKDLPEARASWGNYERDELYNLFCELDTHGNLPSDVWADQLENFNNGKPKTIASMRGSRPGIDELPLFEGDTPDAVLTAKIAHALIWLSQHRESGLRVLQCRKCMNLFLSTQGRQGRPRTFCSYSCTNSYSQAQTRSRRKALSRKTAKHK